MTPPSAKAAKATDAPPESDLRPLGEGVPLDEEGLLCALVIAPSTYSRNRFFRLYEHGAMRSVQRRAKLVRGLVRQLARSKDAERTVTPVDEGVEVRVVVPSLGYRRTTTLSRVEHDLVVYLLARLDVRLTEAEAEVLAARARVEGALFRLSGLGAR
ncbi:MAG: hypothetical protein HOW73_12845 [Polyangiaceae bacterium]|nr:hypothetical protein [Polyangiaceae bacterium]